MSLLTEKVNDAINHYGSVRAAARALNIDHAYLHRLAKGAKDNPRKALLRKLGLERVIEFREIKKGCKK